jgi:hypothetical protein
MQSSSYNVLGPNRFKTIFHRMLVDIMPCDGEESTICAGYLSVPDALSSGRIGRQIGKAGKWYGQRYLPAVQDRPLRQAVHSPRGLRRLLAPATPPGQVLISAMRCSRGEPGAACQLRRWGLAATRKLSSYLLRERCSYPAPVRPGRVFAGRMWFPVDAGAGQ